MRPVLPCHSFSPFLGFAPPPPLRFYRNIFNLELWAPCLTNASTLNTTQPVPAGWTVLQTITLEEPSLALPTPFVTVLGQGSSLAIIIRGTGTGDEWMYGEWVLYLRGVLGALAGRPG